MIYDSSHINIKLLLFILKTFKQRQEAQNENICYHTLEFRNACMGMLNVDYYY